MQSSDAAYFEELRKQFVGCATALQEQVKFNADLLVAKHKVDTEMGEKIASEESLKKIVAELEKDLMRSRRTLSDLKTSLSSLQEDFRKASAEVDLN